MFAKLVRTPVVIAVLGLVVGYAIGAGTAGSDDAGPRAARSTEHDTLPPAPSEPVDPEPNPPEPDVRLTRSDIELTLKTTERQCFGSAGCNVTVEVRAGVDGALVDALPRGGTWDVTYQITGDESGPLIGTFSMYGTGKYDVNEEFLSTPSSETPVTVKLVSVERF